MKQKIALSFLLVFLLNHWLSAQNPAQYTTLRSAQHRQIPGTNVWLVPPKNFKTDAKVPLGFYKDEFNYLSVEEVTGMSFAFAYGMRRSIAGEAYDFQAEREYRINDLQVCEMQFSEPGPPRVGCHVLIAGNDRFCVVVTLYYRSTETSVQAVGDCLHTIFVEADKYPDPTASMPFNFDLTGTGYGFVSNESGAYFFAPVGYTDLNDMPGLLVVFNGEPQADNAALSAVHDRALQGLLEGRTPNGTLAPASEIVFKSYPAIESMIYATDDGRPVRLYQLTIAHPKHAYVVFAIIRDNLDAEMAKVRSIIQTMQFR